MTADQLRQIRQRCNSVNEGYELPNAQNVRDAWNLCREVQQLQIENGNLKQAALGQFSHCGVKG